MANSSKHGMFFASGLDRSSTSGDGPPTWNFYLILESVDRHQSLRSHLTFDVCFRITVDFTLILVYPLWWYNQKPVWHFVAFSQAWRATSRTTKLSGGVFFTVSTERLGDVAEELSLATAFALLRLCRWVTSRRQRAKMEMLKHIQNRIRWTWCSRIGVSYRQNLIVSPLFVTSQPESITVHCQNDGDALSKDHDTILTGTRLKLTQYLSASFRMFDELHRHYCS